MRSNKDLLASHPDVWPAAREVCRERCAFMGEPACFEAKDDTGALLPWPPESCDDPGCVALALSAISGLKRQTNGAR